MNTTQLKRSYYNRIRDFDCVKREFRKMTHLRLKRRASRRSKGAPHNPRRQPKARKSEIESERVRTSKLVRHSAVECAPRQSWARRVFAGRKPPIKNRFFRNSRVSGRFDFSELDLNVQ